MADKRISQVNSLIKKELGELFSKELELPLGCLATISEVKTSRDLGLAKITISAIPDEKKDEILAEIKRKTFKLQALLNKKLVLYRVPKLIFDFDKKVAKAERINQLLDSLKDKR